MKIRCNVCETAEATLLCCADEAALCHDCDEKVHAANKLASKHQRVSLQHSSSHMPKCDVCQDTVGYFFCLEDRALLCRKCDVAIHTANAFVSGHQRFLLTGVKVGLDPVSSSSGEKLSDSENRSAPTGEYAWADPVQTGVEAITPSERSITKLVSSEFPKTQPVPSGALEDITQSRMTIAGGSAAGTLPQWPIDEFLGLNDYQLNYGIPENESSKADSGKLGEFDSSSFLRSIEDDLDRDDKLGQVPDVSWTVPQVPSPPTASGLYWPKTSQHLVENTAFVPDISWRQEPNYYQ